jgi:hypothetical protein
MIRQRLEMHTPAAAYVVRALTVLLALALLWYGLMVVLLAAKVAPHTVNSLSAYRTVFDDTARLGRDFTTAVRLIAGFGGLLVFLVFVYLAVQEIPRPSLTRGEVTLDDRPRGATVIRPRAIERVAEYAALASPDVTAARGRLGDHELSLDIGVRRAETAADTLLDVRRRVDGQLRSHELPALSVNVTVTGYDRQTKRELS